MYVISVGVPKSASLQVNESPGLVVVSGFSSTASPEFGDKISNSASGVRKNKSCSS